LNPIKAFGIRQHSRASIGTRGCLTMSHPLSTLWRIVSTLLSCSGEKQIQLLKFQSPNPDALCIIYLITFPLTDQRIPTVQRYSVQCAKPSSRDFNRKSRERRFNQSLQIVSEISQTLKKGVTHWTTSWKFETSAVDLRYTLALALM